MAATLEMAVGAKTKQALAKLKKLRAESESIEREMRGVERRAGLKYFERATLAAVVLADADWIAVEFNGDVDAANKAVEDGYFADLAGSVTLAQLLEIVAEFPSESEWAANGHNLSVMLALTYNRRRERKRSEREGGTVVERTRVTRKELEEAKTQAASAKAMAQHVQEKAKSVEQENAELRAKLAAAEKEIATLHGRIVELERIAQIRKAA